MMFTFCGMQVRFTEAIYERHLLSRGNVLWLGSSALMNNVMRSCAKGDQRIIARLIYLIDTSEKSGRSVEWSW